MTSGPPVSRLGVTTATACAVLVVLTLASPMGQTPLSLNEIAERYVKLVLAVGQYDAAYVDAYYGPAEWKTAAESAKRPLAEIRDEADGLIRALERAPQGADALEGLRREYLSKQLSALRVRTRMLDGARLSFDEESAALYDAVAPKHSETYFQTTLNDLDRRLPGRGALIDRLETFRQAFVVPTDRLSVVFDRAIAECRRRTLAHVALPADESFTVEYVTNKSWSGYNWYQGNFRSLIQVNTDLPITIDRAIDLACHEGYPGHHVYNVLLEDRLVRGRGWVEMTVYPLFSPQSLIAEGSANYGIDVAFSRAERFRFEREQLFPAAGLNPARVEEYYGVLALLDRLSYAGNEAARQYLNGQMDRAATATWLARVALMSPARAEQRTHFMDDYRSYVINYNLGKDRVRGSIEAKAGNHAGAALAPLYRSPELAAAAVGAPMIDSHCHLADDTFRDDLEPVIARAREAGLERVLVVLAAGDEKEAAQAARVCELWPDVRVTIGVHPHSAGDYAGSPQRAVDVVRAQIARTPAARAIGEAGLDYHYDHSPRDVQQSVFRLQVRLARELDLPIVVHTREADADTLAVLRSEGQGTVRGVLHCFSGTPDLARAALDLGFYISLAGIVTFQRAADLRETARVVPLDRLLTETDSPFLAPVPHRGKRNEPAFMTQVVASLAQIHQMPVADLAARTTANFHTLFRP